MNQEENTDKEVLNNDDKDVMNNDNEVLSNDKEGSEEGLLVEEEQLDEDSDQVSTGLQGGF